MSKKVLAIASFILVMILLIALPAVAAKTRGDANRDNDIDMKDVLIVRKVVASIAIDHDPIAADANADDTIDMKDVLLLRKYVANDPTAVLAVYPEDSDVSTTSSSSTTSTTSGGSSAEEVSLTISFLQQGKYDSDNVTIAHQWTYNKGETATLNAQVSLYNSSGLTYDDIKNYFSWTPNDLTFVSFHESDVVDHHTTYTITYSIVMDSDKTYNGTSNGNKEKKYNFTTDGQGGTEVSQTTTRTSTTLGELGYDHDPAGNESLDLVTLTFKNQDSNVYGVNFHSFNQLGNNAVVEYVQGTASSSADFANATVIHPTENSYSIKEHTNYNATDFTYYYKYEKRSQILFNITDYEYEAELSNLAPGTTYSYRVGDSQNGYYSPIYTFTTKPATVSDFSFVYTADTQPSLDDSFGYLGVNALINLTYETDPDCAFQVSGGDFVYCSDEGQGSISMWRNMINGGNINTGAANAVFAENPWMVTNGNHDNDFVQRFFNNNVTGGNKTDYYSWNYGDAHFIVLDTGHNGTIGNDQFNWLSNDLANNTKKWTVIFLHWPFYCNVNRDLSGNNIDATKALFDTYGVDLCINAHVNADYFTSYPIKAGAKVGDPVVSNGVSNYTNPGGTIYMQNGASGLGSNLENGLGVMYTKDGVANSYPELMQHFEAGYEGSFAVISFEGSSLKVERYYYMNGNAVKYTNGQFTITK